MLLWQTILIIAIVLLTIVLVILLVRKHNRLLVETPKVVGGREKIKKVDLTKTRYDTMDVEGEKHYDTIYDIFKEKLPMDAEFLDYFVVDKAMFKSIKIDKKNTKRTMDKLCDEKNQETYLDHGIHRYWGNVDDEYMHFDDYKKMIIDDHMNMEFQSKNPNPCPGRSFIDSEKPNVCDGKYDKERYRQYIEDELDKELKVPNKTINVLLLGYRPNGAELPKDYKDWPSFRIEFNKSIKITPFLCFYSAYLCHHMYMAKHNQLLGPPSDNRYDFMDINYCKEKTFVNVHTWS